MKEFPKLTAAERRLLLDKLRELERGEDLRLPQDTEVYGTVNLHDRGIGEAQASDLRARLRTFAEDWDRPEAAIYDEDPPQ